MHAPNEKIHLKKYLRRTAAAGIQRTVLWATIHTDYAASTAKWRASSPDGRIAFSEACASIRRVYSFVCGYLTAIFALILSSYGILKRKVYSCGQHQTGTS
jgi:hypothetical protein